VIAHQFSRAEKEAARDHIRVSDRAGEIVAVMAIAFVSLFFYVHQIWSTGFFDSRFGQKESMLLYGSILGGMAGPISRIITGQRNVSRVPELVASVLWIAGSAWLLYVFPFNFDHITDVLPNYLQFLLNWITNDIARILFILGITGGIISLVINAQLYVKVRKLLRANYTR
jgi:hypothetical protein